MKGFTCVLTPRPTAVCQHSSRGDLQPAGLVPLSWLSPCVTSRERSNLSRPPAVQSLGSLKELAGQESRAHIKVRATVTDERNRVEPLNSKYLLHDLTLLLTAQSILGDVAPSPCSRHTLLREARQVTRGLPYRNLSLSVSPSLDLHACLAQRLGQRGAQRHWVNAWKRGKECGSLLSAVLLWHFPESRSSRRTTQRPGSARA